MRVKGTLLSMMDVERGHLRETFMAGSCILSWLLLELFLA
jgi:hypothetical protein